MMPIRLALAAMLLLLPLSQAVAQVAQDNTLQLVLPTEFYAVPDVPMNVYFDNVVLTQTPEDYRFEVKCDIGTVAERRWTVTPTAQDVGPHDLSITATDSNGQVLGQGQSTLRVVAPTAAADRLIRLLIVGDSLTNATHYPNEIARLLSRPSNPRWQMLGTHKPSSASEGVAHEGYGGWTWSRFVSRYEKDPEAIKKMRNSPFVYLSADGQPQLNVARYFAEECDGQQPDFVIFKLGINDCFSAPADDRQAMDQHIDRVFEQAKILVDAFRQAAPEAEIGICLTTPPNARQAAFEANYKDRYPRWGWKRIQHRLVERQLERFGQRQDENIFVVPTELNLDPIDGYPDNNAVHPNVAGYRQIGASIYAWLTWRLAAQSGQPSGT